MDATTDKLFLPPTKEKDDFRFLASPRKNALVKTYIDGVSTFKAMEQAIASAQSNVYLTFWIFNSTTPLFDKTKGKTWGELLFNAAKRGVDVRLILTDFDAIAQIANHANNWYIYRRLLLQRAALADADKLQVICSLHEATISGLLSPLIQKRWRAKLEAIVKSINANPKQVEYANRPGIWNNVEFHKGTKKFRVIPKPTFTISPASHHQKTCVVDGRIAFVGGLDVNKGRIDSQLHPGSIAGYSNTLWHDVHCSVEGESVADVARNFVGRWNRERLQFEKFVRGVNALGRGYTIPSLSTTKITAVPAAAAPNPGKARVQVHRTLSIEALVGFTSPDTVRYDIEQAYQRAIALAERYIYIENQYLRATKLADWLVARHAEVPELQVIIVLPVAPEEVGYAGGADEVTLHGLSLQHALLTRLRDKLKGNLGLYSMVHRAKATPVKKPTPTNNTHSCKSVQILVHSKCMIIDDVFATVGSANANLRSFWMDTEMNLSWLDSGSATKLRVDLWKELLGNPKGMAKWAVKDYVKEWERVANANCKADPAKRGGFIVPHDLDRFKGAASGVVPDEFAELLPNQGAEPLDGAGTSIV